MVYRPASPPRGVGSLQLNVTSPTDHWSVYNYDHIGTPLADITALGYSTYTDNNTTAPILQMEINPGTRDRHRRRGDLLDAELRALSSERGHHP